MGDEAFQALLAEQNLVRVPLESAPLGEMSNAIEVFSSEVAKVRVVTDRGQRYLDLWLPDENAWRGVFTVVQAVDAAFTPRTGSIAEAVRTARDFWPRISTMLSATIGAPPKQ